MFHDGKRTLTSFASMVQIASTSVQKGLHPAVCRFLAGLLHARRECRVDDMDSQGNVRAAGRGVQDSGSVLIKLSHRDPNKAVIKKHNSLVLRAETPADKYSWLVRLKRCVTGS